MLRNEHLAKIKELSQRIDAAKKLSADLARRYEQMDKWVFKSGVWGYVMKANPTSSKVIITDEKKWAELVQAKAEIAGGLEDLSEFLMVLQAKIEDLLVTLPRCRYFSGLVSWPDRSLSDISAANGFLTVSCRGLKEHGVFYSRESN